jgi:hypothetical protein
MEHKPPTPKGEFLFDVEYKKEQLNDYRMTTE